MSKQFECPAATRFYNYFVEQKFSLIFTILLPHIFFEKYTDNISQKLLRVSFISLYFILSKSEPSKYGPYHIDRIKWIISYEPYFLQVCVESYDNQSFTNHETYIRRDQPKC